MSYRPLPQVTDLAKANELARAVEEINRTLQTHSALLDRQRKKLLGAIASLAYVQAIVDEIFDRRLAHRNYRVTCKMAPTGVVMDLYELEEETIGGRSVRNVM